MNKLSDIIVRLFRHGEAWIFAGLLCWLGIIETTLQPAAGWGHYFAALTALAIMQSPVLVFVWYKDRLKQSLSRKRYLLYWLICFCCYLPAVTFVCETLNMGRFTIGFFTGGAFAAFLLELLLEANTYYRHHMQHGKWVQRLGLEKAVLITIILVAVTLAAMAVSSMYNPAYHTKEQLLIGFEFNLPKILRNFGTFLGFSAQFLFMYLCGYLFFYINNRLLVPQVLKPHGFIWYALSVLAVVAFLYPVIVQLLLALPINSLLGGMFSESPFKFENAFAAIAIIFLSLPVVLALQWARQNSRIMSLEKEKAQTELTLLRQQLNPHFFFNTLNNLYALSLQQSKDTPDSILRLSDLMRYVIYKGQEEQVHLGQEVKYIEDYIQLQKIRLKKHLDFRFEQDIADGSQSLAPLLLIVFVENAFKHGIEPAEHETLLHLYLQCDARQLYFSCENSFEAATAGATGIGLENLQKRLSLLYPGKHILQTAVKNHTFKAELKLDLS